MRKGQVLEVSNMSIEELGLHMTQDCLAHTPPILEYFLRVHSKDELAKAFVTFVYEHKIFSYFENPMESLSVIKDDVHIVAYRRNQMQKKSGELKLEMLHGGQERSH
ncbi:unnamed protein product [Eruca vesicaria subsp. sativa]|uniref:Uncharacterized protein n=1 Tax=Eruca vesicaria subsp. sativa TaxID=29727 RepID=A0ABC8MA07_ERUVS|nr:unnamed protein product [Eruca vesicaria subsp. sativa]